MVKSDHEKFEKQNLALQDYIGGLTRSMSKTDLTNKSKK
jgi:short coiled-coil protein